MTYTPFVFRPLAFVVVLSCCGLSLVGPTDLAAQPAFTYNDYANIGDRDTTMSQAQVLKKADVAASGNGHTWDFTGLAYLNTYRQRIEYRTPQDPSSAPFTDATVEEHGSGINGETIWLYTLSNDTLYRIKQGAVTYFPHYPDIVFPMSFGQVYEHSQAQNIGDPPISPAWIRSSRVEYDGYGTLKLPWGTYTDVYRLHWYELDSAIAVPNKAAYISYFWYRRGGGVPLLRVLFNGDVDSATAIYSTWASLAPAGSAGVAETTTSDFTIYPNPTRDELRFSGASVSNVVVLDLLGRVVKQSSPGETSINVTSLAPGVYVLQCEVNGVGERRRFVKE